MDQCKTCSKDIVLADPVTHPNQPIRFSRVISSNLKLSQSSAQAQPRLFTLSSPSIHPKLNFTTDRSQYHINQIATLKLLVEAE